MAIEHFGQSEYSIGLYWEDFGSVKKCRHSLKNLTNQDGLFGVLVRTPADTMLVGLASPKDKGRPAAALLFAKAIGDGLLVQKLPDGRYWLVAALEGVPMQSGDKVGALEEVQSHMNNLTLLSDEPLKTWCSEAELIPGAVHAGFETLVASVSVKNTDKVVNLAVDKRKMAVYGAVLTVSLGFSYVMFTSTPSVEPVGGFDAAPKISLADAARFQQEQEERLRQEAQIHLNMETARLLTPQAISTLQRELEKTPPVLNAGWALSRAFIVEGGMVQTLWDRQLGTLVGLAAAYPERTLEVGNNLDRALLTHQPPNAEVLTVSVEYDDFMRSLPKRLDVISQLQASSVVLNWSAQEAVRPSFGNEVDPATGETKPKPAPFAKTAISFTGEGLWKLSSVASLLAEIPAAAVLGVDYSATSWRIEAVVFHKLGS